MAGNLNYTANATATLTGLPVPVLNLKTCNGAPGQFKNGFYFTVTSETHGKCLLVAYLHLGGLLVRPSVKSFNKNNAVLVHTEMCSYDTHSVSVDIKIPETSSIHKAGPRYSSTHPPFSIKFILWGQDGLIKTMHESMPLYSYAKDPDQVNCQYFSPNPSAPLPSPSSNTTTTPTRERNSHRGTHESPPPSPPQLTSTNLIAANPATTSPTTSPTNSSSLLACLPSNFLLGSTAAAISIPMDSFKSLVAYIQKLERQVEMQQQQLEAARQQEELQHRLISQLAQDIKFKSFQCEVLEEKMQQLSSAHPTHTAHSAHATHTSHTPHTSHTTHTHATHTAHPTHSSHTTTQQTTSDLITLSLNPIMNASTSTTSATHLSPFAYSTTPSTASTTSSSSSHIPSTNSTALPAFSYPTTSATPHSSSLTPINSLSGLQIAAPLLLNPLTATLTTALTSPSTTITTPSTAATESVPSTTSAKTAEGDHTLTTPTTVPTAPTPTPTLVHTLAHTLSHTNSTADTTHVVPEAHAEVPTGIHTAQEQHAAHAPRDAAPAHASVPSTASIASVVSAVSGVMTNDNVAPTNGTEQGVRATEPPKAETQEQEVRDFLTQMQKKQKQDGLETADSEVDAKRQRT
eukprot:Phypoly_transcript_04230.p1 GENE.Phypoly_transcript_04230~~Phypoly_transcript_04230.p1  ORF type:complete len:725 (+),score=148.54 Phypoly_transcript_04230:283-2175(+)